MNNNYEQDEEEYYEKKLREKLKEKDRIMGDVYDVYSRAVGVHSQVTDMTEDYTLTRYDIDIYNEKMPKFIREQRKLLRIIKSYLIIPIELLEEFYNNNEIAKIVHDILIKEYKIIEELLLGELDECVIMGRTPKGEVINAFLKHGLNQDNRMDMENDQVKRDIQQKLTESN